MAGKLTIQSRDALAKLINENFQISEEYTTPNTETGTAQIIDNFSRGIVALTNNTYQNSIVTKTYDIGEILAE